MKLATFNITSSGKRTLGAFQNDRYVDLVARSGGDIPASMLEFLQAGDAAMDAARASLASDSTDDTYGSDQVTLESPVPLPGKIVHTSCNFDSHLAELATWDDPEWESHNWGDFHFEHPTGFLEAPSSVVGSGAGVEVPVFTKQLDYEIEIAIVIGKEAYRVSVEDAFDHVAGYTIFNDLSARDIQAREHSNKVILMGKSFKGSCPLGPWLVTLDELNDPHDLDMKLRVNGELRQDANTSQMHYKTAELVSWWSHMGLYPGDVITSGSPPGVAAGMPEPKWLVPGDTVDATIAKLGTLTTRVV
jgi:2-keto-4-pentenoate hydratase/2-oxohepta-3-ene-1,7-dioic acid hydratase in catechol pathway